MNHKKSYLVALALGLASFLLHKGVFTLASAFSPAFRVQTVEISGQRLVQGFPSLEALKGSPLRFINLNEIKNSLREHPLIADAVIRKQYPSTLKVMLAERIPVAEVHSGGAVYVVDATAYSLPLAPQGRVPQIYADFGVVLNGPQVVDENIGAVAALMSLPSAQNVAGLSLSRDKGAAFTLKGLPTSFTVGLQPLAESHLQRAARIAADIKQKKSRVPKTVDLSTGAETAVGYF